MTASTLRTNQFSGRSRGFSLTELLVVIGIIVLLVGILLVALGKVQERSRRTKTEALMNSFINACTAFQAAHGRYPGVIPDDVLLNFPDGNGAPYISSTENALLHLMGGYRVKSPFDPAGGPVDTEYTNYFASADGINTFEFVFGASGWNLKVDKRRIGEGPIIDGKPQQSMFSAKGDELLPVKGQLGDVDGRILPDLIDAWGQPIIYVRRVRDRGPIAGPSASGNVPPQFLLGGVVSYLGWPEDSAGNGVTGVLEIGDFSADQTYSSGSNPKGSILSEGTPAERFQEFAMLVRHPGVSAKPGSAAELVNGSARGAIVLISAGPDGIYFSAADGPGSSSTPETDIGQYFANPQVIKDFDDIILTGGG
jgi:prepilin-type N-terminal cleavage/methylation domain-containing protein